MNKTFLDSMVKEDTDNSKLFNKLYTGVIATNKIIGMDIDKLDEESRQDLIGTYKLLVEEEIMEVAEAIINEDKTNLINELVDVLVVGSFLWHLYEDEVFDESSELLDNIDSELSFIVNYKGTHDLANLLLACQSVLEITYCNLELAVDEVLRANLSKFPTLDELSRKMYGNKVNVMDEDTLKDADLEQIKMLESDRYSGITCKVVIDDKGERRLTFWCSHEYGKPKVKYLKPVTFLEADLSNLWEN